VFNINVKYYINALVLQDLLYVCIGEKIVFLRNNVYNVLNQRFKKVSNI